MRLLRLVKQQTLISADAFEALFLRHLAPDISVVLRDFSSWVKPLGSCAGQNKAGSEVEQFFLQATVGFDFFSTGFGATLAAPWLLALRNQARAPVRLLFIAHAPGAYILEWALMAPLLRSGDRIIAPSDSAKGVIEYLYPQLSPYIRVVRHPIHPLAVDPTRIGERFVSLSRIHPCRLLHRQIDAMALLHQRGYAQATMEIAGSLGDGGCEEPSPYSRSLQARIKRLGLERQVRLIGTIHGDDAKGSFLSGAAALINLSVTVEESFSKSSVEAIASGIPVLATHWDGLTEAVGDAGILIPVNSATMNTASDVSPTAIADGLEQLLKNPPSTAVCLQQAEHFAPEKIRANYITVAQQAIDTPMEWTNASDSTHEDTPWGTGLLRHIAPLVVFTWSEVYGFYRQYLAAELTETASDASNPGALLHSMLMTSCTPSLERLLGGRDPDAALRIWGDNPSPAAALPEEFFARLVAALDCAATQYSKEICLLNCLANAPAHLYKHGLERLLKRGHPSRGTLYLNVEQHLREGSFEDAYAMNTTAFIYGKWEKNSAALRQLARIGRKWPCPDKIRARLQRWLQLYPDAPDSGPIWFDLCHLELQCRDPDLLLARTALEHAEGLLGETPAITRLKLEYLSRLSEKFLTDQ